MSARAAAIVATVVAIVAGGCAGPKPRLHYGARTVPIDVAFGKVPAGDPRSPDGESSLAPAPGGIGVVTVAGPPAGTRDGAGTDPATPSPPTPRRPPAAADPCPEPEPFAFPRAEAVSQVRAPAPAGTYPYRTRRSFTQDGVTSTFEGNVAHTISKSRDNGDGTYSFDETFTVEGERSTLSYTASPPSEVGNTGQIGLAAASTKPRTGPEASFSFVKPVRLLPLRPVVNDSWRDASSDPVSGTTFSVDGTVVGKSRVNACGQPVEAWEAKVTQRVVTPNQDITSTRTLWFATGYGGLLVREVVTFSGRAGTSSVSGESVSTINRDPGA